MGLILLIAIIAVVVYVVRKDNEEASNSNTTSVSSGTKKTSAPNINSLQYFTENSSEQSLSSARVTNGIVYCRGYKDDFKIGSYEIEANGDITVWDDKHELKIGKIYAGNNTIYLTNSDLYCHVKSSRPYAPAPASFVYEAAKWYGNSILDAQNRNVVASFQGDPVAAAAAFVCLTYEVLMYNKYYEFFHGWNR